MNLQEFVKYTKNDNNRWYSNCIYHDNDNKVAVYTDGHYMIVSKECYKENTDLELFYKKTKEESDWSKQDYTKAIPHGNLYKNDTTKFLQCVRNALKFYSEEYRNSDCVYFKDFGFVLRMDYIKVISMFFEQELKNSVKLYTQEKETDSFVLVSYDMFDNELNKLIVMPIRYIGHEMHYNYTVNEEKCVYGKDIIEENIEKLYSWSDMANELTSRNIPHEVVRNLADTSYAWILGRPIFSILKFDDWLHEKYGDYERNGKSMKDMFVELFGEDADKIAYYFGVEH